MKRSRKSVAVTFALAASFALAACGGGSSGASGAPKITSFVVPASAACSGKTSTTAAVTYATAHAAKQELYVDGRPVTLSAASGSVNAAVHCDPLPHTFVIIAYDSAGHHVSVEKKLTTN